MDPNATLARLRELAAEADRLDGTEIGNTAIFIANEQAELFRALDDFILKGGWLPGDWQAALIITEVLEEAQEASL